MQAHKNSSEPWKVTCVDTGLDTMTGGRLKRVEKYLKNEETFCMTYGDGLSDVNIADLINFHTKSGLLATLTATAAFKRSVQILKPLLTQVVKRFQKSRGKEVPSWSRQRLAQRRSRYVQGGSQAAK